MDSLLVKVVRQEIGQRNVHQIFPLDSSTTSWQRVLHLKWRKLRNNEVPIANSYNLSQLALFPEHYIRTLVLSVYPSRKNTNKISSTFLNKLTLKYVRLTVHTMPVSSRKTSWLGLNTLISALNCCLRFSFRWRAIRCICQSKCLINCIIMNKITQILKMNYGISCIFG